MKHLREEEEGKVVLNTFWPYCVCWSDGDVIVLIIYQCEKVGLEKTKKEHANDAVEMLHWQAPELGTETQRASNEKTVCFGLGMAVYTVLGAELPFSEMAALLAREEIAKEKRAGMAGTVPVSEQLRDLMTGAMKQDAKERPMLNELIWYPFKLLGNVADEERKKTGQAEKEKRGEEKEGEEEMKEGGDGVVRAAEEGAEPDSLTESGEGE
jgi:hypothetical protein